MTDKLLRLQAQIDDGTYEIATAEEIASKFLNTILEEFKLADPDISHLKRRQPQTQDKFC